MKHLFLFPIALMLSTGAYADRILEKDSAKRTEVRYSQIGPRNTLLFYAYEDQQAVLRILIDNQDASFPISGALHLFAPSTTPEGLAKWINNQHSCGLYPEVPKPVEIIKLPEESFSVIKAGIKSEKASSPMGDNFTDHTVKVTVKAHKVAGKFKLKAFEDQSGVFVKTAGK